MHIVRLLRISGIALVLAAPGLPGTALAERPEAEGERESEAGIGVAAGLASVVYAPTKVAYALGGSVIAGLAYVVSGGDQDVAKPVLDASLRGDYVVTPEHLRGQKQLEFVGRPPDDAALADASVAAPPYGTPSYEAPSDGLDDGLDDEGLHGTTAEAAPSP